MAMFAGSMFLILFVLLILSGVWIYAVVDLVRATDMELGARIITALALLLFAR